MDEQRSRCRADGKKDGTAARSEWVDRYRLTTRSRRDRKDDGRIGELAGGPKENSTRRSGISGTDRRAMLNAIDIDQSRVMARSELMQPNSEFQLGCPACPPSCSVPEGLGCPLGALSTGFQSS